MFVKLQQTCYRDVCAKFYDAEYDARLQGPPTGGALTLENAAECSRNFSRRAIVTSVSLYSNVGYGSYSRLQLLKLTAKSKVQTLLYY